MSHAAKIFESFLLRPSIISRVPSIISLVDSMFSWANEDLQSANTALYQLTSQYTFEAIKYICNWTNLPEDNSTHCIILKETKVNFHENMSVNQ